MKIGFITYSAATNYGAVLQTYGLYSFLQRQGNDVEVINYIPDRYDFDNQNYPEMYLPHTRLWKITGFTRLLWKKMIYPNLLGNSKIFRGFMENHVKMTKPYYSNDELIHACPLEDVYITGSDQVWNSDYSWGLGVDLPYYLAFTPDKCKKISYASSFGKDSISDEEKMVIRPLLHKYSSVSVREEKAKNILKEIDIDSSVVCDPTILCETSDYKKLVVNVKPYDKEYVLLFMIGFDRNLYKLTKNFCKKINKKLLVILPDANDRFKCRKEAVVTPAVEEWLSLFMKADYIVTNSFHGTVFSILFNKQFTSSLLIENNGRISNILNKTGLFSRALNRYAIEELTRSYDKQIDYVEVNQRVKDIRRESQKWLINAIKE